MNRSHTAEKATPDTSTVVRRALELRQAKGDPAAPSDIFERVLAATEKYCSHAGAPADETAINAFVERLRLEELALVVRCERGDEAAWSELVERFTPTVRAAAGVACRGEGEAEELASSVWAELYGFRGESADDEGAGRKGKLAYYSGCGSLGGWLRAVVAQLAVDRHRQNRRLVQCEDTAEIERVGDRHSAETDAKRDTDPAANFRPASFQTPEQALAERETTELLDRTLRRAIAELAAEDRLLLKLYYVDELRLREAGAVLGFHEATASRRLAALHKRIRERATALLQAEHKLTAPQIAVLFAQVTQGMTVDMRSLLNANETPS